MKFFSVTFVVALFCAVAVSAAPSPFTSELSLIDESTFGLTDTVTKLMNSLIEKTKCTLDVVEDVLEGTELQDVYKKYRTDVETIIKVNVTECMHTEGLTAKLKCTLTVAKKLNSLYLNFVGTVLKTNKDLALKITKALYQCAKKEASFISNEEDTFTSFEDEVTFGLTGIIEGIYDALIKKTKCALDSIDDIVGEGKFRKIYKKVRNDIERILLVDVKTCLRTSGIIKKTKCFLTLQQKINKLFAKFVYDVTKTNKDMATDIVNALFKCLKAKPDPPRTTTTTTTTPKSTTTSTTRTTTTRKPTTTSTTYKPRTTTTEEPDTEEPETEEPETIALFNNEMTYGVADSVTKVLNTLIEKTKCTLDVLENMLKGTELETVYKELRTEVESILENDVKQCHEIEGVAGKLNCYLTVTQKVNTLFGSFINEVSEIDRELGMKLYNALIQCVHKSY